MTIPRFDLLLLICTTISMRVVVVSGNLNGRMFYDALANLSDGVLGLDTMQNIIDEHGHYRAEEINGTHSVITVAEALSIKFRAAFEAVTRITETLETDYSRQTFDATGLKSCCKLDESGMEYNFLFKKKVNTRQPCYLLPDEKHPLSKIPTSATLLNTFSNNFSKQKYIKWQYYGTDDGVFVMYPTQNMGACGAYDPRFRPWYVETSTPLPKDMVIVFDRSQSMNRNRMQTARDAAKTAIGTLSPSDRVGIVMFSGVADTPPGCYSEELAFATDDNKKVMNEYLETITAEGGTNYVDALETAFGLLKQSPVVQSGKKRQKSILFMTDGDADGNHDFILKKIAGLNAELHNEVVILTYGIGNDLGARAEDLLIKMANQTMFDPTQGNITRGEFTPVDKEVGLRLRLGFYYRHLSTPEKQSAPIVSAPYVDYAGLGVVVSVCKPVYHNQQLQGVAAIDLRLADLLSDVTYYGSGDYSYAFIIDSAGRTLHHPLLPNPSTSEMVDRAIVSISSLEPKANQQHILRSMKNGEEGEMTIQTKEVLSRGNPHMDGVTEVHVKATYYWRPIANTSYSVCIVVREGSRIMKPRRSVNAETFVYHRLDLQPKKVPLCRVGKKLGTRETSVLKLTGAAFRDSTLYFNRIETRAMVQKYEKFIMGIRTSHPNLKEAVRDAVTLTGRIDTFWKKNQYSYWRFIAYRDGVFRLFPGTALATNYDPTIRRWYQSAVAQQGRLVLTPPYMDEFGNGVILTLCKTLVESRPDKTHSDSDVVLGVMGVDIKLNTVKNLLSKLFPSCDDVDKACFAMDANGFLVYHEDFIHPGNRRFEFVHITEKEEDIAADLVNKGHMTQKACVGLNTKKIYNTWRIDIETKVDNMAGPLAYTLEVIPETNVFLGIKKKAPPMYAICHSCTLEANSDVPRCTKNDKKCHCPCYVTSGFKHCQNVFTTLSDNTNMCTPEIPRLSYASPVKNESAWVATIPLCYTTVCADMTLQSECKDYVDCEWCNVQKDGQRTFSCVNKGTCPPPAKTSPPHSDSARLSFATILGIVSGVVVVIIAVVIVVVCVVHRRRQAAPTPNGRKSTDYDNAGFSTGASGVISSQAQRQSADLDYQDLRDMDDTTEDGNADESDHYL